MEKERIDHQVLNPIFSGTEPDRNTLAEYQIHLAAFFGISVYKHLERCVGTHPEKLWVKIPNYFCLSAYLSTNKQDGFDRSLMTILDDHSRMVIVSGLSERQTVAEVVREGRYGIGIRPCLGG